MASSGNFKTSSYEGRYLEFSWSETSQNVANNATTISWKLRGGGGGSTWYNAGNFKVVIAGETVYSSAARIRLYDGTTVASGTYTFKHNSDGTKSFSASAEAGIYSVAVNCTGSGTFTLDPIARASQPSLITWPEHTQNVGNFGTEISIHMNRNSSAFTHTVRYQFGAQSGTIATGVTTGTTWTIPLSLMNLIPNSTSGSGTIYVDTYNGQTKIGTKWCGFTATVPSSVKPTCSIQVLDATDIQETYGNLVKGLSKLYVKTTGTASYSSPIASRNVTANGVRYTEEEVTTGFLTSAGTATVKATVTDKRGRISAEKSASFDVLDYAKPAITALSVSRCNQDGTANNRGEYVKAVFSAAVTSLNSKNGATYKLRYKKTSEAESAWKTVTLSAHTGKYTVTNAEYIFAASGSSSYNVEVTATDNHYSGGKSTTASTAFTLAHYGKNGDSISFGMVDDESGVMSNGLNLKQQGNRFSFSSVGTAETDGFILMARITITASNADSPITFVFSRRKAKSPMTVHVAFKSSSNTTPELESIRYEGENYGAYIVQSSSSVWDLYVQKVSQSDTVTLNDWFTSYRQMKRVSVTFVGSIASAVPNPYYRATPLVVQSILDCFMPVGFIIMLYSHADPNTMYPGTTWVRIYGAFPWFTDENGQIGLTGGERTVTLTEKQIPAHSHGSVYSQHAAGTKDKAWYTTSGTSVAYGAVSTGGGEAHNNMPPYIQLSAWRRTA
jgi:hypothetical protein